MLGVFFKRSVDQLDFDVDFSRWLPDGDTIISATAAVEPAESMVSVPHVIAQADIVKVWVVDGESGKTATVVLTVTTAENRVKQVTFQIRVKD